jgi:hypothetical protein
MGKAPEESGKSMVSSCQAPANGGLEQLGAALEIQFLFDPRPIRFHRADIDVQ